MREKQSELRSCTQESQRLIGLNLGEGLRGGALQSASGPSTAQVKEQAPQKKSTSACRLRLWGILPRILLNRSFSLSLKFLLCFIFTAHIFGLDFLMVLVSFPKLRQSQKHCPTSHSLVIPVLYSFAHTPQKPAPPSLLRSQDCSLLKTPPVRALMSQDGRQGKLGLEAKWDLINGMKASARREVQQWESVPGTRFLERLFGLPA